MKIIPLLFTLSLGTLALGCGGDVTGEAMGKLKTFRDKACKCADVACAEAAEKEFDDWGEKNIERIKKAKPSESFEKEFRKIQREARDCQEKLEEAAKPKEPTPPPPAPEVPPPAADPAAPAGGSAPPPATP